MAVIDFSTENVNDSPNGSIRNYAKRSIDKRRHEGYSYGCEELKNKIVEWSYGRFDTMMEKKNICITADNGIFLASNVLEGLSVVPKPTVFRGLIAKKVHYVELKKENHWYPNFKDIPKGTKVLYLQYPNNPTTKMATKDFFGDVVDYCENKEIIIVSDESQSEIYFEDKPASILEIGTENVIAVNSPTERSYMHGYNVGWVAGDKEIISKIEEYKKRIEMRISLFCQDAAIAAYSDKRHVNLMKENYKVKRNIITKALQSANLDFKIPRATRYVWVKMPELMKSEDFCKRLLEKGVKVTGFEKYASFSLVPTIKECKEAANRIKDMGFFE